MSTANELSSTIDAITRPGKGILAADESVPDDHQALPGARHRVDRRDAARVSLAAVHDARARRNS